MFEVIADNSKLQNWNEIFDVDTLFLIQILPTKIGYYFFLF